MQRITALRNITILAIVGAILLGTFIFFVIRPDNYARITAIDYSAVVVDEPGGRGKVIITERLTFDIRAASRNELFYELWRDLPEEYVDGVKVEYNVIYVRELFDDGYYEKYNETPNLYWYDNDYISNAPGYGPGNWHHSKGPYDEVLNWECVIFYVDGLYRETVVFEIQYEMYNASLRFYDSSELNISLFYGDDIGHLRSVKGQILFPYDLMPRAGNYYAWTFGTNSHGFPFDESSRVNPGYHTFSFELDKNQLRFRPYNQYIEFVLVAYGDDRHVFTEYAEVNHYFYDDKLPDIIKDQADYEALPGRFAIIKLIVLVVMVTLTAFLLYIFYTSDSRVRKKNDLFKPTIPYEFYREIPSDLDPGFAGLLATCKHVVNYNIHDALAASMLSLTQKGYISLDQITGNQSWDQKNIKVTVLHKPAPQPADIAPDPELADAEEPVIDIPELKPLSRTERHFFNLILRHVGTETSLPLITLQKRVSKDYGYTNSFIKNVESTLNSIGASQRFFQKSDYKKLNTTANTRTKEMAVIGLVVLFLANIISYQTRLDLAFGAFFILGAGFIAGALIYQIHARNYYLFTQFGADEYAKWRGLYNFLNSQTLKKERTVLDLAIWECYLVYATAFGISKKVVKALEVRCQHVDTSPVLRNPYFRTRGFYVMSSRSFRNATFTAARTGGVSSGGRYGGSGRGGGGGGGGH